MRRCLFQRNLAKNEHFSKANIYHVYSKLLLYLVNTPFKDGQLMDTLNVQLILCKETGVNYEKNKKISSNHFLNKNKR